MPCPDRRNQRNRREDRFFVDAPGPARPHPRKAKRELNLQNSKDKDQRISDPVVGGCGQQALLLWDPETIRHAGGQKIEAEKQIFSLPLLAIKPQPSESR